MSVPIELDARAEAVLSHLQTLFGKQVIGTAYLKDPAIIAECRPGAVTKDSDLTAFPSPQADWVFGVTCGPAQGSTTCAAVFTRRGQVEQFLRSNQFLRDTLITHWRGAGAVWLRTNGRVLPSFAVDGVHWCSGGEIVPVGCPRSAADAFVSQVGEIKLVEIENLAWTDQQQPAVQQLIIEMESGPPIRTGVRGRRHLNPAFWARFYAEAMQISYDPDRNLFAWAAPVEGDRIWRNEDDSIRLIAELLQTAARSFGATFPVGEIRMGRVRQILDRIRLLKTESRPSDDEVLAAFLTAHLMLMPGEDVASQELRAAYITHCQVLGRPPCPKPTFYRRIRARIRAAFGITQRHDIVRAGKKVRGYSGLALKTALPINPPDVTDVTDGSDGALNTTSERVSNHVA